MEYLLEWEDLLLAGLLQISSIILSVSISKSSLFSDKSTELLTVLSIIESIVEGEE